MSLMFLFCCLSKPQRTEFHHYHCVFHCPNWVMHSNIEEHQLTHWNNPLANEIIVSATTILTWQAYSQNVFWISFHTFLVLPFRLHGSIDSSTLRSLMNYFKSGWFLSFPTGDGNGISSAIIAYSDIRNCEDNMLLYKLHIMTGLHFFTAAQYSPKLRSQKYRCSHHLGAPRNEWNVTISPRHGLDFLHGQQHLLQRILIHRLGHNAQKVLHLPDGRIRAEI